MLGPLLIGTYIFVLSMFVGFEVIGKVAPTLHNALTAGMSAVGGIALLGALYAVQRAGDGSLDWLSLLAIALAAGSVVAGFVLASRLLPAGKKREQT
ncbi:MAG TPA: proton-translocating transhydrogenase family protein [Polyangiaceae bacterium]|nr:proton-translocating transhydrogenase family protein [Polyangiaceae bacterium]